MNVNCIVTMGLVPEIKYLVSCILYLVIVRSDVHEDVKLTGVVVKYLYIFCL